ncbi:hypothetical protein [Streptococcus ferus]|uniref:hypothetical protein n=1 Tax=Streptococcus ferus TaxID=1345 RepID=UPI0035A15497
MITEKLNNLNRSRTSTIKTEKLKIEKNTITTENECIQIHNISMISRNELPSPISFVDGLILTAAFISIFIRFLTIPSIIIFVSYLLYIAQKYNEYEEIKYFITFNLGSSQNYHLYFKNTDKDFRDKVFQTMIEFFDNNHKSININIKNQEIKKQNIYTGDNNQNLIGNTFNNGTAISQYGNAQIQTFDINNPDFQWDKLTSEISNLIQSNSLNSDILETFKLLQKASETHNIRAFEYTVKKRRAIFNQEFIQDTLSGILAGVISTLLGKLY